MLSFHIKQEVVEDHDDDNDDDKKEEAKEGGGGSYCAWLQFVKNVYCVWSARSQKHNLVSLYAPAQPHLHGTLCKLDEKGSHQYLQKRRGAIIVYMKERDL